MNPKEIYKSFDSPTSQAAPDSQLSDSDIVRDQCGSQFRFMVPELYYVPKPKEFYFPAIVIGSGFGGSVAALRLGEAGVKTAVLERGSRWPISPWREICSKETEPDGRGYWHRDEITQSFTNVTFPLENFGGGLQITDYENMQVWRAACLGGGSRLFTGVMIQPKQRYFDAIFEGMVSYEEMNDIYYPRVRRMLNLDGIPKDLYNSYNFTHSRIWEQQAKLAGYETGTPDSIFNWDVVRKEHLPLHRPSAITGESDLGNSNGAKYDLTQNYLKFAEKTGNVSIYTGHEVRRVKYDGNRYEIDVVRLSPESLDPVDSYTMSCDHLFLAAGSIGTSEILLRAQAKNDIPNLNEFVGKGWGTNGDTYSGHLCPELDGILQAAPSASMFHDDSAMPITMESWHIPEVAVSTGMNYTLGIAFDQKNRGSVVYDAENDKANLLWPADGNDDAIAITRQINNRIAEINGMVVPEEGDVFAGLTAHTLGGAVMGKVTDNFGRVLGVSNLYVMDGALVPGTTGAVNPSLTITALAERNMDTILRENFA